MLLKRIELSGFKSFADKTEMEFVRGITAVVGPNGSGKSNISDGIRWVLGEQSAKSLRGGKMEDIIFAGSDARKAVNFGEVSLTLDNSDGALSVEHHEVTVTRRVHRSGDSEYMINRQPCRLKDITELFMDTGIGKEAYSIIGQGRIEEILSTRSEDRRGIFEEASGIVKYKSRKREAQRKLDDAEGNLLRIHDLVSELEDQVEPLREQSERALLYKSLKEELKHREIALYVHQIEGVHKSWNENNARMEGLKKEELELSAVVSRHDASLEQDRLQLRRLEERLEELHGQMLAYSEEFEKCEGQGEVLKERRRYLADSREQLAQALETAAARQAELAAEEEQARAKAGALEAELIDLRSRMGSEENRLRGVAGGTSMEAGESLKGELLEVLGTMAQLRNEIRYAEQQREALQRRKERLGGEEGKWQEQSGRLQSRRSELIEALAASSAELERIRSKYIEESQRTQQLQKRQEEASAALRTWEQRKEALVSRRDTMKEMQDALDGFMHGVREVLKAARRSSGGLSGVHGAVAELVRVPQRIEVAVETALGGAMQHVVMEDERSARAAISFLKQRQLGRATFLPLDVIKSRSVPEQEKRQVAAMEGYVGIAAELVTSEPRYLAIVGNLLGNVLLAENLEAANRIAARCGYRFRVVTLEGDVVNAGGSMTGGSLQKKGASLLGRQRQIEQLDHESAELQRQLARVRAELDDLRKEGSIAAQNRDELREQSERLKLQEQQQRAELQHAESELAGLQEQGAVFSADRSGFEEEERQLVQAAADAAERLDELGIREAGLQEAIRIAEERRKASESEKEELQVQLTDLKIHVAKADQERLALQDTLSRLRSESARARTEAASLEAQQRQRSAEQEELEAASVAQIEELNRLRLRKQETAEQTELARSARADKSRELEQMESETREQRSGLKRVEEQLRQTEIAVNRLDVELDNLLRKLSEEYGLSYELAKARYALEGDPAEAQGAVRELKRRVAGLGEVNLGAIEEYQRVRERFEFLDSQRQDLMEAKATLYEVIREMEDEMSKRFRQTFEEIRRHFVVVFAKLFGGGRADLTLADPERILDTGIDILAQPPGKKLQNLQLLSGGERALTAIALLFAILQVKPVPFCVLDEVEAALDEANVSRFAQYLREFSELTQFIVVTHRKGTMEEADVLYGVTMEEGGVSKLVSVRLEDEFGGESASA
ncbi:chromosome segregation protein SMC [Paenibacillus pasadenensis]|uniref:chromosome segregation protein SMC n=1 Tax=Paenibacillus pasadenensis TaxID=217090 RepID=UPI0004263808|nr:chromosome segregation protein SMC [Paenibacillus pasadenensis]